MHLVQGDLINPSLLSLRCAPHGVNRLEVECAAMVNTGIGFPAVASLAIDSRACNFFTEKLRQTL
jgi:hypothetical protein